MVTVKSVTAVEEIANELFVPRRVHGQRRHDYDHGLQGLQGN